jgi:hypothetical protein
MFATAPGVAAPVLGVALLLAPFALLIGLRVAVGRDVFLYGMGAVVAVLVLTGLAMALVKASAALVGRGRSSAAASGGVSQDALGQDRHCGRGTAA